MDPSDEIPFRVAVGVCWLAYTVVRVRHQAAVKNEQAVTRINVRRTRVFFRIMALTFLLIPFYALTRWFDFAHVALTPGVRWIAGGTSMALFLVLFTWSHSTLGRNWSGLLEIHDGHVLVTAGPYRWIRHPMYSSFILSGIAFLLLSANWFVGGFYLTTVVMMIADRIAAEEQMMAEAFGDAYRTYAEHTGRLWPPVFGTRHA